MRRHELMVEHRALVEPLVLQDRAPTGRMATHRNPLRESGRQLPWDVSVGDVPPKP